jgi:site-specific DNA recombinase
MITIMASLAQQESQSLSQNVKLGLQYRYQQGEIQINCARFLGRRIVHTSPNGKTRTFSSNHVFAQIIICGKCGEVFRRVHWNNRGKKSIVWRCVSRLENTGLFCDARTVLESTIEQVLVTAINQTLCDKDSFLTTLRDNIATVISRESDKALADIDKRLEELQTELLKLATSNADYEKVGDEIHRLRDQKQKLQVENANRDEMKKRIADMSTFIKKQSTALTEYDEQLIRRRLLRRSESMRINSLWSLSLG